MQLEDLLEIIKVVISVGNRKKKNKGHMQNPCSTNHRERKNKKSNWKLKSE